MKKEINYVQCALEREGWHHMAWIPEKHAVVGKVIKIKNDDGTFQEGWKVEGVSDGVKKTAEEANYQSQLYKKTRKASDI